MADVPPHHERFCIQTNLKENDHDPHFQHHDFICRFDFCGRSFRAERLPIRCPGEVLKFQQLPLNNGIYPPTGCRPAGNRIPVTTSGARRF